MFRRIARWLAIGLALAVVLLSRAYLWDMNRAYERVRNKSTVIPSPYGDIEYTEGGSGPDVLVIHGSGGGYDQGELMVDAVLSEQFHWIAPSRFGYLRSTFHDGATFDDQAHAYAYLLDHNAEFAASTIPGARLIRFERGGHLLLGIEQASIRSAVQQHIRDNLTEANTASP
jgi:hypothetical protein